MKKTTLTLMLLLTFAQAEFNATKNGTVKDTITKLEWQDSYKDKDGNDIAPVVKTWGFAISYCHDLKLDGGNWRLPNINELKSLIKETQYAPTIDSVFTQTENGYYLSSTTRSNSNSTNFRWGINFTSGNVLFINDKYDKYLVRCVRDEY